MAYVTPRFSHCLQQIEFVLRDKPSNVSADLSSDCF